MSGKELATPLDPAFLDLVLAPYLEGCRYVQSARVQPMLAEHPTKVSLEAECGVPYSCYIKDTGHFNAVEANIAFNQMFYLAAAHAAASHCLPELGKIGLERWVQRQLQDVLIRDYQFQFSAVIDARRFFGQITIELTRTTRKFFVFAATAVFTDAQAGRAEGQVKLVVHRQDSVDSRDS